MAKQQKNMLTNQVFEERMSQLTQAVKNKKNSSGLVLEGEGSDARIVQKGEEVTDELKLALGISGEGSGLVYEEIKGSFPDTWPSYTLGITKVVEFNGCYIGLLGQSKTAFFADYSIEQPEKCSQYLYSTDGLNWEWKFFGGYGNWVDAAVCCNKLYVLAGASYSVTQEWDDLNGDYVYTPHVLPSSHLLVTEDGINWEGIVLPEDNYVCMTTGALPDEGIREQLYIGTYASNHLLKIDFELGELGDYSIKEMTTIDLGNSYNMIDMTCLRTGVEYRDFADDYWSSQMTTKLYFCDNNNVLYYYGALTASEDYGDGTIPQKEVVCCGELPSNTYRLENQDGYLTAIGDNLSICFAIRSFYDATISDIPLPNTPEFYKWAVSRDIDGQYLGYLKSVSRDEVQGWTIHYCYCDIWGEHWSCLLSKDEVFQVAIRRNDWLHDQLRLAKYNGNLAQKEENWATSYHHLIQEEEEKTPGVANALWPELKTKVLNSLPKEQEDLSYSRVGKRLGSWNIEQIVWNEAAKTMYCKSEDVFYISEDEGRSFIRRPSWYIPFQSIIGVCGENVLVTTDTSFGCEDSTLWDNIVTCTFEDSNFNSYEPDVNATYGFTSGWYQNEPKALLYNETMFALSSDGLHWNYVPNTFGFTAAAKGLYGNGSFVLLEGNNIYYLNDDNTWSISESLSGEGIVSIQYGQGIFMAQKQVEGDFEFWTSKDGVSWTLASNYSTFKGEQFGAIPLVYYGDKFVLPGFRVFYGTYDGTNWFICNSPEMEWEVTEGDYESLAPIHVVSNNIAYFITDVYYFRNTETKDGGKTWGYGASLCQEYDGGENDRASVTDYSGPIAHTLLQKVCQCYDIVLMPSDWDSSTQRVKIYLGKNTLRQDSVINVGILPNYAKATFNAGIYCVEQGEDYLILECNNLPTQTTGVKLVVMQVNLDTITFYPDFDY